MTNAGNRGGLRIFAQISLSTINADRCVPSSGSGFFILLFPSTHIERRKKNFLLTSCELPGRSASYPAFQAAIDRPVRPSARPPARPAVTVAAAAAVAISPSVKPDEFLCSGHTSNSSRWNKNCPQTQSCALLNSAQRGPPGPLTVQSCRLHNGGVDSVDHENVDDMLSIDNYSRLFRDVTCSGVILLSSDFLHAARCCCRMRFEMYSSDRTGTSLHHPVSFSR